MLTNETQTNTTIIEGKERKKGKAGSLEKRIGVGRKIWSGEEKTNCVSN